MQQHTRLMAQAIDATSDRFEHLRMSRDPEIRMAARKLGAAVECAQRRLQRMRDDEEAARARVSESALGLADAVHRAQRRLHRTQDADEAAARARARGHARRIQEILARET